MLRLNLLPTEGGTRARLLEVSRLQVDLRLEIVDMFNERVERLDRNRPPMTPASP